MIDHQCRQVHHARTKKFQRVATRMKDDTTPSGVNAIIDRERSIGARVARGQVSSRESAALATTRARRSRTRRAQRAKFFYNPTDYVLQMSDP